MHRIDRFLDRLMPKTAQEQHSRENDTKKAVVESEKQRESARNSMVEAYRKAGVQFASPHRRWDD